MLRPHEEAWALSCPVVIRHGPVGLLHVDAHMDTADKALGEKIYHGTPFRRCVDEGLLDCKRVVQIGIRGSSMTLDPYTYSRKQVTDRRNGWRRLGRRKDCQGQALREQDTYLTLDQDKCM